MKKYLPLMFVVLAIAILILLNKSREGVDDTLVRLDKLETTDSEIKNRLSLVETELKTAKEEQAKGEAQVNAGIGNIQSVM